MPLHVIDTAGLRAAGDDIEAEGIRRAHMELARADRILFVIDISDDPLAVAYQDARAQLPPDVPVTLLLNKCDRAGALPISESDSEPPRICVSALTGFGLDALRLHLKQAIGYQTGDSGAICARARHLQALTQARAEVEAAARQLADHRAGELIAEHLRGAQQALGEITGEFSADDLLGRIFSSFCIGK